MELHFFVRGVETKTHDVPFGKDVRGTTYKGQRPNVIYVDWNEVEDYYAGKEKAIDEAQLKRYLTQMLQPAVHADHGEVIIRLKGSHYGRTT